MALLISALLALIALAGLAWNAFSGGGLQGLLTVDGLFSSLIFASMFAIFAFNSLTELRALRVRRKQAQAAPAASATAARTVDAGAAEDQAAPELVWLDRARPVIDRGLKSAATRQAQAENIGGLTRGSILVNQGAPLPAGISAQQQTGFGEWELVDTDATRLQRLSGESSLQLFYFVGPVEKSAFGLDRKQTARKALARALEAVEARGRNAAEITRLRTHNFLGLSYAEITLHMRHLQQTPFGFETQPGSSNGRLMVGAGIMPASPEEELSTAGTSRAA